MPETLPTNALVEWLEDKPSRFIAGIASRIAMRTLPVSLIEYPNALSPQDAIDASLHLLRGTAVIRAALKAGDAASARESLQRAQRDLGPAFRLDDRLDALRIAFEAAGTAPAGGRDRRYLAVSLIEGLNDHEEMLEAAFADCRWADQTGGDYLSLLGQPLWPDGRPEWFDRALRQLHWIWLDEPDRWNVWRSWFDWRLKGLHREWGMSPKADAKIIAQLLLAGDEFWYNGDDRAVGISSQIAAWAKDAEDQGGFISVGQRPYEQGPSSDWTDQRVPIRVPFSPSDALEPLTVDEIAARLQKCPPHWAAAVSLRASLRSLPFQVNVVPPRWLATPPVHSSWAVFPAAVLAHAMVLHRDRGFPDGDVNGSLFNPSTFDPDREDETDNFDHITFLLETGGEPSFPVQAIEICERATNDVLAGVDDILAGKRFGPMARRQHSAVADELTKSVLRANLPAMPEQLYEQVRFDLAVLSTGLPVSRLLARPLWDNGNPDWVEQIWRDFRDGFLKSRQGFEVWTSWYDLRLSGGTFSFDLASNAADVRLLNRIFSQNEAWWQLPAPRINADIAQWLDEFRLFHQQSDLLDLLASDELLAGLADPSIEPEGQSSSGLTFSEGADGRLEVSEFAGADQLLTTPEACDFHAELKETLVEAAQRCAGHNQAASLAGILQQVAELMGNHPSELRIGRFMQKAERCLKLADAMVQDLYDGGPLASLPVATREIATLLEALSSAYWAMVHFDPALDAHLRNLKDRDLAHESSLRVDATNAVLATAVADGVLTPKAAELVAEMGEGLDSAVEPDPRREQRFGETVRNVSRALLSKLWHNRGKIAKGIKEAGTRATAGSVTLYGFAKFLVGHVEWVHQTLAGSPGMLHLADELIALCKLLPF